MIYVIAIHRSLIGQQQDDDKWQATFLGRHVHNGTTSDECESVLHAIADLNHKLAQADLRQAQVNLIDQD